jgi:hypothetical protein
MPIKKQHEWGDPERGLPPDKPRFSGPVIQEWHARYMEERERQHGGQIRPLAVELDDGPKWRGSYSSNRCDRQLQYHLAEEPVTEELGVADHYTFMLGEMIHDIMQTHARAVWPSAQIEVPTDLRPYGINGAMSIDLVVPFGKTDTELVIEAKSKNGFGFKRAATTFSGPPEGPMIEHVVQMAMGVKARPKAEAGAVVYWTLEKLSPDLAHKSGQGELGRVVAEWWYQRDAAVEIADHEIARIQQVTADVVDKSLTPRTLHRPGHRAPIATITNPQRGEWIVKIGDELVDHGTTWHCGYCPFQSKCLQDGAGDRLL